MLVVSGDRNFLHAPFTPALAVIVSNRANAKYGT